MAKTKLGGDALFIAGQVFQLLAMWQREKEEEKNPVTKPIEVVYTPIDIVVDPLPSVVNPEITPDPINTTPSPDDPEFILTPSVTIPSIPTIPVVLTTRKTTPRLPQGERRTLKNTYRRLT